MKRYNDSSCRMAPAMAVRVESLNSDRIAPYGAVLSRAAVGTRRIMPLMGEPEAVLMRSQNRAQRVEVMERHHRVAQIFIPLAHNKFAVVVALPDIDRPSPLDLRAFCLAAGSVLMLYRGVWHAVAPLVLAGTGDYVLLTDVETSAGEATEVVDIRRTAIVSG